MHYISKAPELPKDVWFYLKKNPDARRLLLRALQPTITSTSHSREFEELKNLGVLEQSDIRLHAGDYETVLTSDYSPAPSANGKFVAALADHLLYLAADKDRWEILNNHLESVVNLDGIAGYLCTTNIRSHYKPDSMLRHYRWLITEDWEQDRPTDDTECLEMKFVHPRHLSAVDGQLTTAGSPRLLDAIFRPEQSKRHDQIPYLETRAFLFEKRLIPHYVSSLPQSDKSS